MLSFQAALLVFLHASAVISAATGSQHETIVLNKKANYAHGVAGAAYFITNEPGGNYVVAAQLYPDGKLTFDRAVSTRGLGAHGINNGSDPLFSQNSIKTSAVGKVLAVVNSGSNTVSLFSIDPENPLEITQVGEPISSEGEFPISVAFNNNGTRACVLNGGEVNGVHCYAVDTKQGLIALPDTLRALGLNQTTPATGPPGSASQIIFSEDDTKLIASVKGVPPTPGFLAIWDVAVDGSLSNDFTKITPGSGGMLPFSMTIIPGQDVILATDPGVGFEIYDLSNMGNSSVVPVAGEKAICWSSYSAKTGNFYLSDAGAASIVEVSVDKSLRAQVVNQYQQTPNSTIVDNDTAVLNGKGYLYVLEAGKTSVASLSLDAPGQAKNIGSFSFASLAKAAGLTINALNLQGMTTFVTQKHSSHYWWSRQA